MQGLMERISRERLQPLMRESYLCCARWCESTAGHPEIVTLDFEVPG